MVSRFITCAVEACTSTYERGQGVRMFCFPRNKDMCQKWVQFCGNASVATLKRKSPLCHALYYRVCALHFEDRCFCTHERLKLNRGSIPTIFTPELDRKTSVPSPSSVNFPPGNQSPSVEVTPRKTIEEIGNDRSNASPGAHALTTTKLGIRRTTNSYGASVTITESITFEMDWPNDVVLKFVRLYERQPVIWNPAHPLHRDKSEIIDAWKRIRHAMDYQFTVNDLKRKKDSLMATYRVLNREMKQKDQQGIVSADVRKPNWFAYSAMDRFLSTVYKPRIQANSEVQSNESENMPNDYSMIYEKDEASDKGFSIYIENSESDFPEETRNLQTSFNQQTEKKKLTISRDSMKRRVNEAYKIVKAVRRKHHKDDCALFGELLANKLRRLHQRTRDIVMNDIDNLIFRATINNQTNIQETSTLRPSQCSYAETTNN
ncbi:hypothetical protein J437_LFUL009446 [Ladona fulva]|uniref:MADF domain-containing protein n=1 Tax=Ladona fulva TaxID=123851 RepID=A0A8K0K9E3_LADFU|nr:hypothetical protein J437_LFUL009446 [Ladona fulva]